MPAGPLAEVFGFPLDNFSADADRSRNGKLCPFHNKVPACTKDKAERPLGVCSVLSGDDIAITCPVRFRQDWLIAKDAATFFFPTGAQWAALTEVRLNDKNGVSAGNIDIALVSYDQNGALLDFGALEVQAVYISGNVRQPLDFYMQDPRRHHDLPWTGQMRPDFLSSSRKRLAPQLMFKGGIIRSWGKKIAVAVDKKFFAALPQPAEVEQSRADMAWFVYSLDFDPLQHRYRLARHKTVYTEFIPTLAQMTVSEAGPVEHFLQQLQTHLNQKGRAPFASSALSDASIAIDAEETT